MRFWSSLLLFAFGGVLTAAPAARLPRIPQEKPPKAAEADKEERPGQEQEPRQDSATARVVVLRGFDPGDEGSGADTGAPASRFEQTPALRARKLCRARPPQPPRASTADADVRAGLIATPPPAA